MGETVITFQTDQSDPSSYDDVESVGRVYEVGLNGEGYMLLDMREQYQELRYRRAAMALDPERFATTETPFAESIERYVFAPFSDFSDGAGQHFIDRIHSTHAGFYDSLGVDPFTEPGELTLLPETAASGTAASTATQAVTANTRLYLIKNGTTINHRSTIDAAGTDVATLTAIDDICSDGQYLYVLDSGVIKRGKTAWSSDWTSGAVTAGETVSWAGQRICVSEIASGSTPNQWDTLDKSGAREAATPRLTLDAGWSIGKSVTGGGFIWFPAWSDTDAVIYRWQIGTDEAPVVAWHAPEGLSLGAFSLFYYQDNLMVRAYHDEDGTKKVAYIYRCALDAGANPVPELITTLETASTDHSVGGWGADNRFVYFGWDKIDGSNAGIGCIDLSTGGYAKWLVGGAAGPVRSILEWKHRIFFSIDSRGVDRATDDKYDGGYLITSVADKNSTLPKLWDEVRLLCEPIVAGQSITVHGSIDHFSTWGEITDAAVDQVGGIGIDAAWAKKAQSAALKVTLYRGTDTTTTPTLRLAQLRAHPMGLADQIVILPVNCADHLTDLRGRALPESRDGGGSARARTLENLAQSRVKFQDIDYADTETSYIMECESVEIERVGMKDRRTGKVRNFLVAVVTLRRLLK